MLFLSPMVTAYILFVTAVLGLVMGSFLNCLAWRVANGESILKGRSHCAHCNHALGAADLVPVFSYLFLGGRCRYCGKKIAPRYMYVELLTAVCYIGIVLSCDVSFQALRFLLLASILITISLIDYDTGIIPDSLVIAGIVVFLALCPLPYPSLTLQAMVKGLVGGFSVSLPLLIIVLIADKLFKRETMGGGDIKLLFMIGLYFTWQLNILILILSCFAGIGFALATNRAKGGATIPFGPAIACSTYAAMLFGAQILRFYLGFFSV